MIAYGFIAGVSTLLMLTVAYFHIKVKNPNEKLRKSLIDAAITFWDTVLWFGLLGCIASLVYATSKAQSLYEFVISLLVVNLICNSMFLLLVIYSSKVQKFDKSIESFSRVLPQAFVFICMFVVTMELLSADSNHLWGTTYRWSHYNFVDMPCYAASIWPMHYLRAAAKVQAILLLSPFILALLLWIMRFIFVTPYLGETFLFKKLAEYFWLLDFESRWPYPVVIFTAVVLWMDFGFIVVIRTRARADFGTTFEDDAFGYGQIISAGIAVQAIYAYLCGVFGEPSLPALLEGHADCLLSLKNTCMSPLRRSLLLHKTSRFRKQMIRNVLKVDPLKIGHEPLIPWSNHDERLR